MKGRERENRRVERNENKEGQKRRCGNAMRKTFHQKQRPFHYFRLFVDRVISDFSPKNTDVLMYPLALLSKSEDGRENFVGFGAKFAPNPTGFRKLVKPIHEVNLEMVFMKLRVYLD